MGYPWLKFYTPTTGCHEPREGRIEFGVWKIAILFWNSSTTPTKPVIVQPCWDHSKPEGPNETRF